MRWKRLEAALLWAVLVIAVVGSCVRLAGEYVPPEVAPDLARRAEAGERLINKLDRPPKQVHLSVKLVVLSDEDAEKVRTFVARNRLITGKVETEETHARYILCCPDFAKLMAFLNFVRTQTKGSVIQAPQGIILDHEEATIDVGELFRGLEVFLGMGDAGPLDSKLKGSPFSPDIQIFVIIPHVTGPDNNVILTVIPKRKSPRGTKPLRVFQTAGSRGELMPPQTFRRVAVTKIMVRDRETAVVSGLRGRWRGEKVNLFIFITPTVVNFEKGPDIRDLMKRAQEE